MDNATKPLTLAVSVFITCIVILLAIFLSNRGAAIGNAFASRMTSINQAITDNDLLKYDSGQVSGADVVNCIRKYKDDITINVTKIIGTDGSTYTSQYSSVTGRFDNVPSVTYAYINPNAEYNGKVMRNANGVISTIEFVQSYYVADAGPSATPGGSTTPIAPTPTEQGLSQTTITALISSLESTKSQVESQIVLQTQTINNLLEQFAALQEQFANLDFNGGSPGSGSEGSNSEVLSVISDLAKTVETLADTLDGLVNRFDIIADAVSKLTTKVDGLAGVGGNESDGSESGGDTSGDDDTTGVGVNVELRANIEELQNSVASLSEQINELNSVGVTEDNLDSLIAATSQLRYEAAKAQLIAQTLVERLETEGDAEAGVLQDAVEGIITVLTSMEEELNRIASSLQGQK